MQRAVVGKVHGRVQGVGFRYSTIEQADALGVAGWVGNRYDGTVAFFIQGESEHVEAMLAYLGEGPRAARVDRLETRDVAQTPGLTGLGLG